MAITMQVPVIFTTDKCTTPQELQLIREMGIDNVDLNFGLEFCNETDLTRILTHLKHYGLTAGNLSCMPLQKNKSIILGCEDRDEQIDLFNNLVRLAAKVNVPLVSVAWQPNGILRSGRVVCDCSYGAVTGYADMAEIDGRDNANDRAYDADEIWDNFKYFLDKVMPVCKENNVRLALHPNDPPVPILAGVASLIYNVECYRKAFALDDTGLLTMKMCVGCWLEGGDAFGDLMSDIEEFVSRKRVSVVHFRNVSGTMPVFYETLAEDGYANMYDIMKQFVKCGYDGVMSVDHVFSPARGNENETLQYVVVALNQDENDNPTMRYAYPTGYAKGLLHAAERELGKR